MTTRKIVQIDEENCDGCGQCVPACAEGALRIVGGKARLVGERYCDGLGACLGECPQDAITIVEREAEEFDGEAVAALLEGEPEHEAAHAGCPAAAMFGFAEQTQEAKGGPSRATGPSALRQWPVQLGLVPAGAPFLDGADLLLAADCVGFAMPDFHARLLAGRRLLVACPKLDDAAGHARKLTEILRASGVRSLAVAHMEVPCCFGLTALARRAVERSGRDMAIEEVTIDVRGRIKDEAATGP